MSRRVPFSNGEPKKKCSFFMVVHLMNIECPIIGFISAQEVVIRVEINRKRRNEVFSDWLSTEENRE